MRKGDMDYLLQTYHEQRAEARACGYEFPDFEEWLDPSLTRRRAQDRLRLIEEEEGTWEYYETEEDAE